MDKFTMRSHRYDHNSNYSYLVIQSSASHNYAWIANPNQPILHPLGILTLDQYKTLKITHENGDPVVLYSAYETSNSDNISATLLDSGNFVLQDWRNGGSTQRLLWQSFDFPVDTLLPDQSGISEFLLTIMGRLYDFDRKIDVAEADYCYGSNTDAGCQTWDQPTDRRNDGNKFEQGSGYFNASGSEHKRIIIIWICTASAAAAALLIVVLCIMGCLLRRRNLLLPGREQGKVDQKELLDVEQSFTCNDVNELQEDGEMENDLRIFIYASVMAATGDFSGENKGKLMTGRGVAVKRLSRSSVCKEHWTLRMN
ncbi:hypothetical protein L3X38_022729 [Prunus dulcis]|uniref:Bulb-type lectin domain-containing protein n=1 Tax=Prunus dulcis TaxID=3755 RepID=A0AAD4VWI3_PRUDU|nr:hypothetical protein L3X38_022729 [Prunus dulcis]